MHFCLIGGDRRFLHTEETLRRHGHTVCRTGNGENAYDPEAAAGAEAVILPLPASRDGLTLNAPELPAPLPLRTLFSAIPPGIPVFCGRATPAVLEAAGDRRVVDYEATESFRTRNAGISADAAVSLLSENFGDGAPPPCVLIGSGRFATALSSRLYGLRIPFSVCARNPDRVLPGYGKPRPLSALPEEIAGSRVLLNTVPAPLFSRDLLLHARPGTQFFELSAAPGVIREEDCRAAGIILIRAPGLPARFSPVAAGRAIADEVLALLSSL